MAQGNKPLIYYCLAHGGARFMYAPPAYHGEIGVQNCHCGKTYPDHVTINVAEEIDHLLGKIEDCHQEGDESNQEEQIPAQEVQQVQEQPNGEMDGMIEDFEEDPKENHRGNVEEESESRDGIVVVD
ncbi:hypothetical protein ACH5RR_023069 [Cinchona calisaya]|uniref:Uncharacterized protein n=1 Tax=Cinchona calisaya TaxID=153742 RepID=A0ABD2ZDI5_9GENT